MQHILLLVNPYSGKKEGKKLAEKVKDFVINDSTIQLKIVESEYVGHFKKYILENDLSGYSMIVVIGGDGTMSEIVNAICHKNASFQPPILLLPAGGGNAFNHDLMNLDFEKALHKILNPVEKTIDILAIKTSTESYYSFNVVGWGMVAQINQLSEKLRWLFGLRYTVSALIKIFQNPVFKGKLIIDGKEVNEKFSFILMLNTQHTGKAMKMAPFASLEDGLVDVIYVKHVSLFTLLSVFPQIFTGKHIHSKHINYVQCANVELQSGPQTLVVDGEPILSTPFSLKVMKQQLKVIV